MIHVVGQGLACPPVRFGRLLLGHDLVGDAEGLPEGGDGAGRSRPEVPVGAELLLVGGQTGDRVTARVDGGLDEHDTVGQAGSAQVALQRDEGAGDERALVLAERQEGRQDDDLAAQAGERHGMPLLIDQRHRLRRRPIEDQSLVRRWRAGRGRSRRRRAAAECECGGENGVRGPAASKAGQASSSPGGRNVKGRSASAISLEAMKRARSSKTGTSDDGSSSCCSLKRSEPS